MPKKKLFLTVHTDEFYQTRMPDYIQHLRDRFNLDNWTPPKELLSAMACSPQRFNLIMQNATEITLREYVEFCRFYSIPFEKLIPQPAETFE